MFNGSFFSPNSVFTSLCVLTTLCSQINGKRIERERERERALGKNYNN